MAFLPHAHPDDRQRRGRGKSRQGGRIRSKFAHWPMANSDASRRASMNAFHLSPYGTTMSAIPTRCKTARREGRPWSTSPFKGWRKAKLEFCQLQTRSPLQVFENVKAWSLWLLDYDWLQAFRGDGKCSVAISPCSALGKAQHLSRPATTLREQDPRKTRSRNRSRKGIRIDGRASTNPTSQRKVPPLPRTERRMGIPPQAMHPRKRCSDQCCASQGLSSTQERPSSTLPRNPSHTRSKEHDEAKEGLESQHFRNFLHQRLLQSCQLSTTPRVAPCGRVHSLGQLVPSARQGPRWKRYPLCVFLAGLWRMP